LVGIQFPSHPSNIAYQQKTDLPIPTQTQKQPKPKNQPPPQPKHGTGKIQCNPSPHRTKNENKFEVRNTTLVDEQEIFYSGQQQLITPTIKRLAYDRRARINPKNRCYSYCNYRDSIRICRSRTVIENYRYPACIKRLHLQGDISHPQTLTNIFILKFTLAK
jgi:hypothetical protein